MSRIAIIPARSGSKRLTDKNIKYLNGKPLIAYTIEAALKTGIFDVVHVSTDSKKYSEIAKNYGADVPFLRSENNSTDKASSWDMVKEVLDKYSKLGYIFQECTLLQPTSPLRNSGDILNAQNLLIQKNADSVVSVCELSHPLEWCIELNGTLKMKKLQVQSQQKNGKYYRLNGAIYMFNIERIKENDWNIYSTNCLAYIMKKSKSVDIDEELDFKIAELIIKEGELDE